MAYKHVIRAKTKNLFDVNKITESTNLKNNKDGTITVSVYGVSGGLLKNLCPELKVGDVIKVYFQPLRWTAPNPPLVMVVGDVIFDRKGNSKLTVTEKSLNKPVLFYNNHYEERGLPGVTIIGNILITTDLTITNKNHNERYTPYNYLQSNKRMIKVSDVCQLLDKSKYPATKTENGITWTNNGDGTITANGTATNQSVLFLKIGLRVTAGKYCVLGKVGTVAIGIDVFVDDTYLSSPFADSIFTIDKESILNVYPVVENGDGANSITIKPQIFNLTEMFGAGHEPATVAEFRQRFPNEYYPYSPQCWLTSYKSAVVCKTKNLFDINSYFNVVDSNIIINGNSILCVATNQNAHVFYKIPTVIGEKYTVSNKSIVRKIPAQAANFGIFISDNNDQDSSNYLPMGLMSGQSFTFTARTEFLYVHWYITYGFSVDNSNSIEVNELQVELGDTATDYVPYGHL